MLNTAKGLDDAEKLYCFLKALLPIPKRRIPAPRRSRVTGQGKGQPENGFGMPANINIESRTNNAPAIMKSHFDTVNMVRLLLLKLPYLPTTRISSGKSPSFYPLPSCGCYAVIDETAFVLPVKH
jgi:hypothetical protein